jgi:tetratricopeptide (TPR) repeat protein
VKEPEARERLLAAVRHRDAGEAAQARRCVEEVLAAYPEKPEATDLMAALAADDSNFDEGYRWARRSMDSDPRAAGPHYTLGRLFQAEGLLAEAEASYLRAIERAPDSAKAHNNIGCVQHMLGRLDLAVASYRRALALDATLPQASQNLAAITSDPALAEGAIAGYLRQLGQNPDDARVHNDLGNVYRELGRHRDALASFAAAVALDPELADAHFSRAHELLLCGEYAAGWKEHEWRWKVKALGAPMPEYRQPLWDGAALPGKTLLIHAEQGLGDTIQFIRYAPLVAQRCGAVILECQPQIAALLRSVPAISRVIARGEPLPAFDAHIPVMSLPRIFETTVDSVPWDGPYIRAEPHRIEHWRRALAPGARLHVGLAWAGRPQNWDDRKRSIPLAEFAPLFGLPGLSFYSLQWGEGAAQISSLPAGMRIRDFGDAIRDFSEMAALIASLDLVVTVCTSVSHLAGALGAPTWLLAAYAADWRWLLERDDTPWYPSMRIFRQAGNGDWPGVIEDVAGALA